MTVPEQQDYVQGNRAAWDKMAADYEEPGRRNWAAEEPSWGIYDQPESVVGMFEDDLTGKDAIELGCGTAYVSAWLARRGARPVGVDNSPAQLENARKFQQEFGVEFPLHLGNAEATPFPDASFDFAISEYGASIWCDPYLWVPEAARLLRPGGRLVFLANSVQVMLCSPLDDTMPADGQLHRAQFGMHAFSWSDGSYEFHLAHGDMIRLLRENGFEIEELLELQAPEGAVSRHESVRADWARQWPYEEVWKARKR